MKQLHALGVAAFVLAGLLGWELAASPDDAPSAAVARATSAPTTPAAGPADPDALALTLLARPLFSPERQPAPAAPGMAGGGGGGEPPRLSGIIIGPSGKLAIFDDGSGRAHAAAEGGRIGSATVGAIAPGEISLNTPGGERVLRPRFAEPVRAPGAPR